MLAVLPSIRGAETRISPRDLKILYPSNSSFNEVEILISHRSKGGLAKRKGSSRTESMRSASFMRCVS